MKNGPYTLIVAPKEYPGKRYRGRYCYEHHFVWWKKHGSAPSTGMEIHHKNGDHRDNRLKNLVLLTAREHKIHHGLIRSMDALKKIKCDACGIDKWYIKSVINDRRSRNLGNKIYCSKKCGRKNQILRMSRLTKP